MRGEAPKITSSCTPLRLCSLHHERIVKIFRQLVATNRGSGTAGTRYRAMDMCSRLWAQVRNSEDFGCNSSLSTKENTKDCAVLL